MNSLSYHQIQSYISDLEKSNKCSLKSIIKKNQIIVKCNEKDCPFKLKFQQEVQNYIQIFQNSFHNHKINEDQTYFEFYLCKKELNSLFDTIEKYVEDNQELSPKPLLRLIINQCSMSPLLKNGLQMKNCRLRKKFDNIINQIKRNKVKLHSSQKKKTNQTKQKEISYKSPVKLDNTNNFASPKPLPNLPTPLQTTTVPNSLQNPQFPCCTASPQLQKTAQNSPFPISLFSIQQDSFQNNTTPQKNSWRDDWNTALQSSQKYLSHRGLLGTQQFQSDLNYIFNVFINSDFY